MFAATLSSNSNKDNDKVNVEVSDDALRPPMHFLSRLLLLLMTPPNHPMIH